VSAPAIGFTFRPERPPEDLAAAARAVEAAGFEELWLWEDCFLAGGFSASAVALAVTERLRVGLGIVPAPVRNVAFAAMEIAGVERMFPGRFLPGVGHGVPEWMAQVSAKPASQLTLLEEYVTALRALLAGEEASVDGRYVKLDAVRLDHPPVQAPAISTGVRGPKSLALSGRVADGTILDAMSTPAYIESAVAQIAATRPHRITVYAWSTIGADGRAARDEWREPIAERLARRGPQVEWLGVAEERPAPDRLPDEAIAAATVAGTPEECLESIRALGELGADAVVLVPPPGSDGDPLPYGRALGLTA
jgi:5,10-methylenetetrahydromethanopterin reductase